MGCGVSSSAAVAQPGVVHDKILLLSMEMPHYDMLHAAARPSVKCLPVNYDGDGDGDRSTSDMIHMTVDMVRPISSCTHDPAGCALTVCMTE